MTATALPIVTPVGALTEPFVAAIPSIRRLIEEPMSQTIQLVITSLEEVFRNKGLKPPRLAPDTDLTTLGLESLDFAEVVVRMDAATGMDPFSAGGSPDIRTVADLAQVYDDCAASGA